MVAAKYRKATRRGRKQKRRMTAKKGGSLQSILPITTWGSWSSYPGALAWSSNTTAPPPLANGGLYTGAQSTGEWASSPFPATQYALAVESAKIAHTPEVFYHQRPNDNAGASYSPYVGTPISSEHYSAKPVSGGGRRRTNKNRKH